MTVVEAGRSLAHVGALEHFAKLADVHAAAHHKLVPGRADVPRQAVEFVLNVADQLLENIFLRDHADDFALLVADQGQVMVLVRHPPQRFGQRHRLAAG